MPGLVEGVRRKEEKERKSTYKHEKVLSPKGAVSLSGETVMHTNHAEVGQNNEG